MTWNVCDNEQINLCEDQFIGGDVFFKFSNALETYMNLFGFSVLGHAKRPKESKHDSKYL